MTASRYWRGRRCLLDAGNVSVLWNAPCWPGIHPGPAPSMEDDRSIQGMDIGNHAPADQVEAVKPYFERFMEAFPTVSHLAQAEDDYLMKMWEGLGYYNRVRNLQKAAIQIMEDYGGVMPDSYEELLKLKGIGSYTAGAVSSLLTASPIRRWTAMSCAS